MPRKTATTNAYSCCQCHNNFDSLTEFYKTYSTLYTDTGHLPICKDCFLGLFNSYADKYHDRNKAMQRICMAFDLYYDESLFNKCCKEDAVEIGNYMKRLNMVQYQGKTFDTNINEGFVFGEILDSAKTKKSSVTAAQERQPIKQTDIEKWGDGLEPEEYKSLNTHYKYLKSANPNCDSNQEIFIINLCEIKMQQARTLRDGNIDAYSKLTELYRKIFQQAGLKTVKEATTSAEDCWSSWTGIISRQAPEEYYKDKQLYKDMDGLDDYFKRNVGRPVNNLEFGTTERDYEYFVGDEEDGE